MGRNHYTGEFYDSVKKAIKKIYPTEYMSIKELIAKVRTELNTTNFSYFVFFNMRKADPEFDQFIIDTSNQLFTQISISIENVFLRKLARGEGSASEYIFFLKNTFPEKYKEVTLQPQYTQNKIQLQVNITDEKMPQRGSIQEPAEIETGTNKRI